MVYDPTKPYDDELAQDEATSGKPFGIGPRSRPERRDFKPKTVEREKHANDNGWSR